MKDPGVRPTGASDSFGRQGGELDRCRAERLLLAEQGIAELAWLCRLDEAGQNHWIACVVPRGPLDPEVIAARLPEACRPSGWLLVAALPRSADGTVDTAALRGLPVLDPELARQGQARLAELPGVGEAAVAWVESPLPQPSRLHLRDLVAAQPPPTTPATEPGPAATRDETAAAAADAGKPALVDGGAPRLAGEPRDLAGLLVRAAREAPDKGVRYLEPDGGESFQSFPELLAAAERVSAGLRLQGVGRGDAVILQLGHRRDLLTALWACFLGRFVPLPAAVASSYEASSSAVVRLHNAWTLLERPLILADRVRAPLIERLAEPLGLEGLVVAELERLLATPAPPSRERPAGDHSSGDHPGGDPDELALFLMTSGSTGKPKLVTHTHASLLARVAGAIERANWNATDVSLNWLTLDHVASLVDFHLRDVFLGCNEVQAPTEAILEDPLRWLDWIDRFRVTVTWAPHFAYALLAERAAEVAVGRWDLSCLRCSLNGGEAIVPRTARRCLEVLAPHGYGPDTMQPVWGMSETGSGATYGHFRLAQTTDEDTFVDVGRAIPGISIRIVDDQHRVVPEGVVGRLQVRGPVVTPGYHRRPELNREVFTSDGWFRTGDLAFLRDGRLTLTGREADVVIVNGLNYYSHEIESVVDEVAGVQASFTAACGVRQPGGETEQLAIFCHTPLKAAQARAALIGEIRQQVLRRIGLFPDHVLLLARDEVPKTAIGKIQRSQLKQRFEQGELEAAVREADLLTANARTLPGWFFRRTFRPQALDLRPGPAAARRWLLLGDDDALVARLRRGLPAGTTAIAARSGEDFAVAGGELGGDYACDPLRADALDQLFDAIASTGGPVSGILSLRDLGGENEPPGGWREGPGAATQGQALLALLHALVRHGYDRGAPLELVLAASRSQGLDSREPIDPHRAALAGLVATARREMPWLNVRHVDLPAGDSAAIASQLAAEMSGASSAPEAAWRGGRRLVPKLEALDFSARAPGDPPFEPGGVYLLTGGLGGIGRVLARHLASAYRAKLLLVGRTPLAAGDGERERALGELAELGGEVAYLAADLARPAHFGSAVRRELARWGGRLDGVIHLAATFHEASLLAETPAGLAEVLAPKVEGCRALAELVLGTEAFFLAFSSVNSFFGGANVGAYAAANRWLEAFCHDLGQRHAGLVRCFAWSMWDDVGMSRGYALGELSRARGYATLSREEGLSSLLAALATGEANLLIGLDAGNLAIAAQLGDAPLHALRRLAGFYERDPAAGAAEVPDELALRDRFGTPTACALRAVDSLPRDATGAVDLARLALLERSGGAGFAEPQTATEKEIAALFRDLLGVPRVGLSDSFFQLGGHSILATQLLARLRASAGVEIETARFLTGPTVAQLAEAVDEARAGGPAALGDAGAPAVDEALAALVPDPAARFEPFPMTEIQQAYWIGESQDIELGRVAMHFYQEIDGVGLDLDRLGAAWQAMLERHDMLRAVILPRLGMVRVLPEVPTYAIAVEDLRHRGPDEVANRLAEIRDLLSHRSYALDRWPWFELRATLLDGQRTRLHLSTSVIHLDGGSLFLLMTEWGRLYRDLDAPLPALAVSFRDYALALEQVKESAAYRRALAYWQERIPHLPAAPALPLARSAATLEGYRFRHRTHDLSAPAWRRLEQLAAKAGLSRSVTVLTAYALVLGTWGGGQRFLLNVTLFNRLPLHPQIGDLIGDFTSMVLLAVERDPEDTFETLARRLQDRLWTDLQHRQVSGVTVARELGRALDRQGAALTPVVFTSAIDLEMRGATSPSAAMSQLGKNVFHVSQTPQVLLDFQLFEEDGGVRCIWDAVEDAFAPGVLDDMFGALVALLDELTREEAWKSRPELLPAGQLLDRAAFNATAAPVSSELLHTPFFTQAASRPERLAVATPLRKLSYGELDQRSRQVGAWLGRRGARPNQLVAVVMDKGWEQVVAVLGVHCAGAAYLPIDPGLPQERRFLLLASGRVELVLSQRRYLRELAWPPGLALLAVDGDDPELALEPAPFAAPPQGPDDLAYVIFTSGSTGAPKGVMIDHRGAVNTLLDVNRRFAVGPGDRVLALSALSFDLSVYDVFGVLAAGGTIVMPDPDSVHDAAHWLRRMDEEQVTLWNTVPALMELLVDFAAPRTQTLPDCLRLVLLSGDWIPLGLPERIRSLASQAQIVSLGGATEASVWSILYPVERIDPAWSSIPYGRPMANQAFHVLDAGYAPCPTWVPGHLFIGGIGVARGYWDDPDRTAASFIHHPRTGERLYRTGDLGRMTPDGTIEFLGRDDTQVKVRGHRIELGEIEATLNRHPGVKASVVLAIGEGQRERRLVAWALAAEQGSPTAEELRGFLADRLPHYMVPEAFAFLPAFPLSATGKVDRGALARRSTGFETPAAAATARPFVAPRNPLEAAIANLWAELLKLDAVGVHDHLLQLGGNSLMAIMAITRLRETFGVEVPLRTLLASHPTVATLATTIAQLKDQHPTPDAALPRIEPAPADRHLPFPLHPIQEAYWIGRRDAFELGNVAAYFYLEVEVPALDTGRFELAWQQVVRRHDMLRAIVTADGSQRILPETPAYKLAVLDLRERDAAAAEAELAALRERMAHQVLPADRWPLFELRASQLAGGRTRLHFGLDLLVADAWSVQILFRDLERCYRVDAEPLPPLTLSYRDYLLAERGLAASELYRRSHEYWWARLDALPPAPQLPLVKDLSRVENPRFVRRRAVLEPAVWAALRDRTRHHGLTPSGLLAAAFGETLGTWSRGSRFTLNLTTFNRLPLHAEVDEVVGDFTSLTLLVVDTGSAPSFVRRAQRLQEQLWEDLEHRYVSGLEVLRELARRQGRNPGALAPIVFTSLLARYGEGSPDSSFLPLQGELVYATSQTPQVWLDHQVIELEGGLAFTWDVVEELLPAGMLDEVFAAYVGLLRRLALDDEVWHADSLGLVPSGQLQQRSRLNSARTPFPDQTLHGLFQEQVEERADEPAIIDPEHTLSYRELARRSRALADRLRAAGAQGDQLVAVVLDKGWRQAVATLATLEAGAAYLPIAPDLPTERRFYLLANGKVNVALTDERLARELAWPPGVTPLVVDAWAPLGDHRPRPAPASEPSDLAYVIFTSGSTGQPKGVAIEHRGAVNTLLDVNWRFAVGPHDRVFALSALNFDLSVYDFFGIFAAGGAAVLPEPAAARDPGRWLELLERHQVTIWNSVPALLEMLVEHATPRGAALPASLRLVLLSGDWIPVGLPAKLAAIAPGARLVSLGGATEASVWSIFHPVTEVPPAWTSIPYGRPLANQSFHVLDAALEPRPVWVPGELFIGGAGLARCYWGDEAKTAERFLVHPRTGERLYRTGDHGRYLPDGTIEFLGREDLQVKIQGHRIELGEIEAVLGEHPGIAAVACVAVGEPRGTRRLVACHVASTAVDDAELRRLAESRLPSYMVPAAFLALEALPLTANGKVDRAALGRLAEGLKAPAAAGRELVAPRGELEAQLAAIWSELLDLERLSVEDNLFNLGGSSLLAIQVTNRLRELYDLEVPLRGLLDNPTVAGLARLIAELRSEASGPETAADALPTIVPDLANRHQPFPLNAIQQAYWVGRLDAFDLGNVAAHSYFEMESDALDLARFERIWRLLIERHDMLRAIVLDDGQQQILASVPPYEIEVSDLVGRPAGEVASHLAAVRETMSHQNLDPSAWPLLQVRASRLDGGRIRLHISVSLLISDAWSARMLFGEAAALYRDPEALPAPLTLSFRDYALVEPEFRRSQPYLRSRDYWLGRLAELPPAPDLPLGRAPGSLRQPRFERRAAVLEPARWSRLQELADAAGVRSLSAMLLAAFGEVLALWSRTARFTVNVTTFNRLPMHPEVDRLFGDFTSLTLVALDLSGGDPFERRVQRVQEQLWADLEQRHFNGVEVLRELAQGHGWTHGAPVVFTSMIYRGAGLDVGRSIHEVLGQEVFSISQTPQVWLDCHVVESGGALTYNFDAVEGLFPAGMLDSIFGAYRRLLESLADGAAAWRGRPDLVPAEELARRRAMNDATMAPIPELTLHDLFARQARRAPDQPAVIGPARTLSYGELERWANRLGRWLRAEGAVPDGLVAVVMDKGWEQAIAVLATFAAGAAYLPIDAKAPAERLAYLLANSGARLVLTQSHLDEALAWPAGLRRLRVDEVCASESPSSNGPLAGLGAEPLAPAQGPRHLAYLLYTSGSTGQPKGVMIEHRSVVNRMLDVVDRFAIGPADRVLALTALHHDLSVFDLLGIFAAGGTAVLPAAAALDDPAHWARQMVAHRVSLWNSVPAYLEILVTFLESSPARQELLPRDLRWVILAGDFIPVRLPGRLRALVGELEIIASGGPTETTIWDVHYRVEEVDPAWQSIPYGKPLANARYHVLDEQLRQRPVWAHGQLAIAGEGLARGYWRDPERTAEKFIHHPETGERLYLSGDLGRWLPDGNLEILGRMDLQVKVRGHRIELGEIEAALAQHELVRAALVVAVGATSFDRRLVAFVVAQGERPLEPEELRTFLAAKLPQQMVPAIVRRLDALPLTANGKVDRRALERAAEAQEPAGPEAPKVAPRTELESQMAAIWCQLLALPELGVHDNLFHLGGNSLLAIQAATRMREAFEVEVPLRAVLGSPTVAGLAAVVAELRREIGGDEAQAPALPLLVPDLACRHEPFPLNEIQQAYWVGRLDAFELGNVAAHYYVEQDNPGLDLARFEHAWQRVVARHDMLRAVVEPDGRQRILAEVPPYRLRTLDLRGRPAAEALAEIAAIRREMSHQVLAADRWPLFELRATLLDGGVVRIHFSLDLLIADAWSSQIFFQDMERFYRDPGATPPPFELSFRDYLLADRALHASAQYQRSNAYWLARLDELPPAPELPLARDPGTIAQPSFVRRHALLAPATWERLEQSASHHGLTSSGLLLAVFSEVLAVWSKTPRFTLNVTTFRRLPLHPQIEQIVGDFTSLTLLAVDASSAPTLAGRARRLQEQLWQDLEHRTVSGIAVLRQLGQRLGLPPGGTLMPIVFTSLLARYEEEPGARALEGDPVFAISQTPQVWLDHQVSRKADGSLEINWDVVEELFPAGMIDQMFAAFTGLLGRLAESEAPWEAARLDLLPATQRQLLEAVNATAEAATDDLLQSGFFRQAAARPDAVAVVSPDRTATYGELAQAALALGQALRRRGAVPGELVAVLLEKSWEQVVAALGVVCSGAAYLPIDPGLPAERIRSLLDQGGARLVLASTRLAGEARSAAAEREILEVDLLAGDPTLAVEPWQPAQTADELAYVIFTSGSTGRPKGVAIDHRGAVNTIRDVNRRFGVGPNDRVLALSALNFDLSVYDLFGLLAAGGALVLPRAGGERDPGHWCELVARHQVTIWNSVPALMEMLVEHRAGAAAEPGAAPLASLRLVLLSGDWIPVQLPARIRGQAPASRVISLGGATEASIWSILYPIAEVDPGWKSIPYGRPMVNQRFHVFDAALEPRPTWVPGELFIGGLGLARGYWGDEARTAERFLLHPRTGERLYRTGDFGRWLPGGEIEFLGREDLQVKVQGHRIELGEIDFVLAEHPGVAAVATVVLGDPRGSRRLAAGFVAAPELEAAELRRWAEARLPSYMVPPVLLRLDAMPLSSNGKVDRAAVARLAETLHAGSEREGEANAPRTALEWQLGRMWKELLDLDQLGIHDNIFSLGGNSLIAIKAANHLRETLGVEVPLRAILGQPTVAELAAAVAELRQGADAEAAAEPLLPALVPDPANRHQPFPLNEIQQAYWVGRLDSFELGNVAAHYYVEQDNLGLDLDRFERAWQRVIARHDMLRAVVEPDGWQRILPEVPPYQIRALDLRDRPPTEIASAIAAIRREMSHQVLAADRWPLFDLRMTLHPGGLVRIHFSLDLLIADAWSTQIFFQDLERFYADPGATPPPLELSFRDYLLADRALAGSALYQRSAAYWSARLDDLPPAPELPLARDPGTIDRPSFVRRSAHLDPATWAALEQSAGRQGLTPSGLLLATFSEVLATWSKAPRFTLNVTTFRRLPLHPEVERIVGDFTSLTLLAVDGASAPTLAGRARHLQEQLWLDLEHRYVSGIAVLRQLGRHKGLAPGETLLPIVFTSMLTRYEHEPGNQALERDPAFAISQTPQVWLDHQVSRKADGSLEINWDVVDELFPAGLIDHMFAAFTGLLRTLAASDAPWTADHLDLLPPAQKLVRDAVNATAEPLGADLLHSGFFRQAAARPDAVALATAELAWTYGELSRAALRLGHELRRRGARPGTLVAVLIEKSWEQVVAALGVLAAGAAYLPIDPGLPGERVLYLLEQGEVRLVLASSRLAADRRAAAGAGRELLDVDLVAGDEALEAGPLTAVQTGEDLAYVIFTSGSTGKPKGVAIDHRGAVNTIADVNRRFAVGVDDRVLAMSALNFDLSVYDLFGLFAAGGAVVLPRAGSERDPQHWYELITRHQVSIWNSVPALLEMLVEHLASAEDGGAEDGGTEDGAAPLGSLRLVLLSGDWIPLGLPDRVRRQAPASRVISLGGATEASIWSILYPIAEVEPGWKSIPYGRPMVNQGIHVLDGRRRPRPDWVPGDLYVSGVGLARGYWRDEEKTRAAFVTDPASGERLYRTGDLGRWLPSGDVEFLGREDLQVKVQGYRIELGEIEAALAEHPAVHAAVVLAPPVAGSRGADGRARRLVAYVVTEQALAAGAGGPAAGSLAPEVLEPIFDPVARLEFKLDRRGVRRDLGGQPVAELPSAGSVAELAPIWARRRSHRRFEARQIPLEELGHWLACLRQPAGEGGGAGAPRYASAGGLYPVQLYLALAEGAVSGLAAGIYHYHPVAHCLERVSSATLDREVHGPDNRPIFDQAAFSLFLVARMRAIGPIFPESGRDRCLLEAGAMGQLLMNEAPARGLGLCPLGGLAFDVFRDELALEATDELLHTFLGGAVSREPQDLMRALQEDPVPPPKMGNKVDEAPKESKSAAIATKLAAGADRTAEAVDWRQAALVDPAARERFRRERHGLRAMRAEALTRLPAPPEAAAGQAERGPLPQPLPLAELGRWLENLRSIQPRGLALPKYRYPSGGGLYPVQVYLHVQPGRVDGLPAGDYAYDPVGHRLVLLQASPEPPRGAARPAVSQATSPAVCTLFLVGDLAAVAPLYPGLALDFCHLEAGYMGQLLQDEGEARQLGLAELGPIDAADLAARFRLGPHHRLVQSFACGPLAAAAVAAPEPLPLETAPTAAAGGPGSPPAAVDADRLKAFLADKLPAYMVPASVVLLDRLPLTANGKVDRHALPLPEALTTGQAPAASARVAPRSDLERHLVAALAELLGHERIGIDDNFFELGASSVQIIQLQRHVAASLGQEIPITEIFRHPTVASLAAALGAPEGETETDSDERVELGQEQARRRRAAGRIRRHQRPGRE